MNLKAQHKKQMRQSILDAASTIIVEEGIENLTIRKIATAISYSVPMVYEYFLNKESLLKELKKEWLKGMQERVQSIYVQIEDPKLALEKIAVAYFEFAKENSAFYRAVMGHEFGPMDDFHEIRILRMTLKELIQKMFGDEQVSVRVLEDQVDLLRSILHGVVSLACPKDARGRG